VWFGTGFVGFALILITQSHINYLILLVVISSVSVVLLLVSVVTLLIVANYYFNGIRCFKNSTECY
jgi:hypothetical protein